MIERQAIVVSTEPGHVWVSALAVSACQSCHAADGCGAGALNRWLAGRQRLLRVASRETLQVGDEVLVGIRESALVQGSLLLYLVPLLAMLVSAVIGRELAPGGWADPVAAATGLVGLLGSLLLVRSAWLSRRFSGWQPVILKVGTSAAKGRDPVVLLS